MQTAPRLNKETSGRRASEPAALEAARAMEWVHSERACLVVSRSIRRGPGYQ